MGRPSTYTDELGDEICDTIEEVSSKVVDENGDVEEVDVFAQITHPKKKRFLVDYAKSGGNVVVAANRSHISRESVYYWKKTDAEFRKAFDVAHEIAEYEYYRQLVKRGKESDVLFIFRGKSKWKEIYGDKLRHEGLPESRTNIQINLLDAVHKSDVLKLLASKLLPPES